MPTARYSLRVVSAKRSTSSGEPMAAKPSGSGHCENGPAISAVNGLLVKEFRGSLEMVTGMPRGWASDASCTVLCQVASSRAVGTNKVLKWFIRLSSDDWSDGLPNMPGSSRSDTKAISWNISPALSGSVIRSSRSSTRCSMGRAASW